MLSETLEEIHRDPAILDRAIAEHKPLEILADGKVAGTLIPAESAPRQSRRGFPISVGLAPFGAAEVARIESEADPRSRGCRVATYWNLGHGGVTSAP